MHTDVYSVIGRSHSVNQDYGIASRTNIVLSDGCSSAPLSDWGARLLAQAMSLWDDPVEAIKHANKWRLELRLPKDCLCATLLCCRLVSNSFVVNVSGDGLVAIRDRYSGAWTVLRYDYPSGAPFYLRYLLDEAAIGAYQEQFDDTWQCNGEKLNGVVAITNWSVEQYDTVAMFSDGIFSFDKDIVEEMLDFKSYCGVFLQRRIKKLLLTHHNQDDLTGAGITVPQ